MIFSLSLLLMGCHAQTYVPPGYRFDLFDSMPSRKLALAVKEENVAEIKRLVAEGKADINLQEKKFGQTLLHLAIDNQKVASVDALLEAGADFNIKNKRGYTPIHELTDYYELTPKSHAMLQSLIAKGADVNALSRGTDKDSANGYVYVPLKGAVRDSACAKLLLENGADAYVKYKEEYSVWRYLLLSFHNENIFTAHYMIVEKKMKVPNPIFYRMDSKAIDIFDFLDIKKFPDNASAAKLKARQDILDYLKAIDFPNNEVYKVKDSLTIPSKINPNK